MIKVALTGHKPQRLNLPMSEKDPKWDKIKYWIESMYTELYKLDQDIDIYCGMSKGCDIKFGITLMSKPGVKLHCVLPCKEYNSESEYYSILKERADEWIILSEEFYKGCDNVRDKYMVDHCDILLAIWDRNKSGGVWNTIKMAKKSNRKIIYIPKDLLLNN